jgi:hypothetical protein
MRLMLVQPHMEGCDQPGAVEDPTAPFSESTLTGL